MLSIDYTQVTDRILVGSYPQQPEDIIHLKGQGVTAVLSLQSDEDLDSRAVKWDLFWKFYVAQGIHVVRVPITDFDVTALRVGLPDAVKALDDILRAGHRVYLHCTAGINRSPTVAIAWLMQHDGRSREEAVELIREKRPKIYPYPEVLDAWERTLG